MQANYAAFLPDSRLVVRTLTGEVALTARASLSRRWLRRRPVLRGLVCFLGCPIYDSFSDKTYYVLYENSMLFSRDIANFVENDRDVLTFYPTCGNMRV